MPECRSCGAAISWLTTSSGKKMPVNSEEVPFIPDEAGQALAVSSENEIIRGRTCSESFEDERWIYARLSHFATCPNADNHRRS